MSHLRAVPDGPAGPRESTVPPRSGSASSVRVEAPGKVNLFLSVGAPGPDGYHPLTTVFQAVRLIETVTARRQSAQDHGTVTLTLEEPDGDVPVDESNLAVRAATLLAQTAGVGEGGDLLTEMVGVDLLLEGLASHDGLPGRNDEVAWSSSSHQWPTRPTIRVLVLPGVNR